MLIGIPKETKGRVQSYTATPPAAVRALCEAGHKVFVEKGAGSTCSSEARVGSADRVVEEDVPPPQIS